MVLSLQKRHHRIFAAVRDPAKAAALSTLPNITLDVTSPSSIAAAVETITEATAGRGLDILINNAGGGVPTAPVVEADLDAGRRMFEVNVWGALAVVQAFLPLLLQARGMVVNIASAAAVMHTPYMGIYGASKAAITAASETMRLELKPLGVSVMTTMVTIVTSRFHDHLQKPEVREGSLYKPAEKWIQMASTPGQGTNAHLEMPVDKFAERLSDDILAGRTGKVWRGGLATVFFGFAGPVYGADFGMFVVWTILCYADANGGF